VVPSHQPARDLVQTHYLGATRYGVPVPYGEGVVPGLGAWWREAVITATAFALCLLGAVLRVDDTLAPPPALAYVLAAVSSAALLARRRAPLVTVAVTTVCGMLVAPIGLLPTPLTVAPALVSAYSLALRAERRTALAVLPSAALLVVLMPVLEDDFSWADTSRLVTVAASPLVAAVLGRSTRHRRASLALVEERALRAEESRDSEARRKVVEERVRIARELHDLVAHQITLANAQASVAAHLFDTHPDQARASVDELVRTTRHALDELRATVGLLRHRDDGSPATEPAPGLSRLPTLVESFRRAGLEVSVQHHGTARPLPPAVDLTAYRIIQEALTNVTKHAGTGSAEVCLAWDRERVTIRVTDDGPPSLARPQQPPGHGLIGMRERAAAVGGELVADRRPEGGFSVAADLPLPAAEGTGQSHRSTSGER
jgi:signal transduction histidine kinase